MKLVRFKKSARGWQKVDAVSSRPVLNVFLHEDMNTPPKVYAQRDDTAQPLMLWDLNPQFQQLRLARVEEVSWEWSEGQSMRGGLYFPAHYRSDRRYPLIIQTHGWNRSKFWIDGYSTTAYAAQVLAARGFFVLQLLDQYVPEDYGIDGQRREVEKALQVYRSSIAALEGRGLIDRRRVGIIGFSHTCFYVKWALTHEPALFAAASITEGEDGGYLQYIAGMNWYVDDNSLYGGPPFGKNLAAWVQLAPGFNISRVRAPLWITSLKPRFLLLDWEWFQGLRMLNRPVELLMLADAEHILQKPAERMSSQGGNVDWFDFWLNNHEDPDSEKESQYARWRELRQLHDANLVREDPDTT